MERKLTMLCGLVIALSFSTSADVLIKATGAKESSAWNAARTAINTINGSGLSVDYITGDAIPSEWASHATGSSLNSMWICAGSVTEAWAMYDLGAEYDVTGLHIWNQNESNVSTDRSLKDVDIYFATSSAGYDAGNPGDASWGSATAATLAEGPGTADYKGEDISLSGSVSARYVLINATSSYADGFQYDGLSEVVFTAVSAADTTLPILETLEPANGEIDVALKADLVATFDENILVGAGNITITNLTDGTATFINVTNSSLVTVAGSTLTINPDFDLDAESDLAVLLDTGVVIDVFTNAFAGISDTATWSFSTVEDNSGNTDVIVKAVRAKVSSYYNIGRQAVYTIDGSGLDVDYATGDSIPALWPNHETSPVAKMWITDGQENEGDGWIMFDLGAEYELTGLHVWNQNEVAERGIKDMTIYFATSRDGYADGNEGDAGWGNAQAATLAAAPVTEDYQGEDITLSSSVTARYVLFNTETTHGATYSYTGLSEVMFTAVTAEIGPDTTPPFVDTLDPANGATNVVVSDNLVAHFDENILVDSGNITLTNLTAGTATVIDVTDTNQVSVAGATLTINPVFDLEELSDYAVLMDAGLVTDMATNAFAGIANPATWSFSTLEIDRSITGVTVLNSSPWYSDSDPTGIVDGQGLTADGLHSAVRGHNFLSNMTDYDVYVTLDLAQTYALDNIHVWNYNETGLPERSAKDVEIWVSPTDTNGFVKLDNAGGDFVFPQAPASDGYAGFDLDLSGVVNSSALDVVRLIRFNITSNYVNNWTGLAEVRFEGIPVQTYSGWISTYPGVGAETGENDDPDNDGFVNLKEFAFGGNPDNAADTGYPCVAELFESEGINYFAYVYAKRVDADLTGLTYLLEQSTDLVIGSWTTNSIEPLGIGKLDPDHNVITNGVTIDGAAQKFLKLDIHSN